MGLAQKISDLEREPENLSLSRRTGSSPSCVCRPVFAISLRRRCSHSFAQNAERRQNASRFANWRIGKAFASCSLAKTASARSSPPKLWPAIWERTLYRVDLGVVVSKYIGETEKNLHARLRCGERRVMRSSFSTKPMRSLGKRTEVHDSHDRYANIEINYLLQRIEEYAGVAILATGKSANIDKTFLRRFHFVICVPPRRKSR